MIVTHNSDTTTDLNDETLQLHPWQGPRDRHAMAAAALPRGCVLHIAATPEALGPLVADRLCGAVSRAPAGYIGLATGATPLRIGLWAELSRRCRVGRRSGRVARDVCEPGRVAWAAGGAPRGVRVLPGAAPAMGTPCGSD